MNIYPPDSKPYNLTFAEHAKNYWKWALKIPASDNPVNDQTGEKCAEGQSNTNSSVFYLSFNNGGKSERTCKVPAGKGLLIPVMQVVITDKDIPGASIEELARSAKKIEIVLIVCILRLVIKNMIIKISLKYQSPTDAFEVIWADKAIFGMIGISENL